MALLASCWLIVESFVVPHGFLKWFYLSFYIHPLLLLLCQIFLWLKVLKKWLLFLFLPLSIAFRPILFVLKRAAVFLLSFVSPTAEEVFYDALEPDIPHIFSQDCETVVSCSGRWNSTCPSCKTGVESGVFEMGNACKFCPNLGCIQDSWLAEYLCSDHYNSSVLQYGVDTSESLSSSESIAPSPTDALPDQDDGTASFLFSFSFTHQSLDFKSHESITQELIQENQDPENSSPSSCDSQFLERMMLTVSGGEGSNSPVSKFDSNYSSSTADGCYALSATDMLVDPESFPAFCGSNSPVCRPSEQQLSIQDDADPFHQKYASRMRFFNTLYHERLDGMSKNQGAIIGNDFCLVLSAILPNRFVVRCADAILNEQYLTNPGFFKCVESSTDMPMQYVLWSRMARKRLLRSLECDLEMICVAQSCLLWEALHHQFHKVEALKFSDNPDNIVEFHPIVSGKFQDLQILLERFVEDQRFECQGSSINTHKRLSFQGLLQVPDATGFIIMEEDNKGMREEGISATQVLEAIYNCIKAFWLYIKTEEKKSWWTYKGIRRTNPPVEDPLDLELLYDITRTLHKKGIMLKDLQGKSKCWLRGKVKPLQTEVEKRNLLFAMIDLKLVQRLLKMPLVSTSHLKWCQEKLNDLDFKQGKVFRGHVGHLFPPS